MDKTHLLIGTNHPALLQFAANRISELNGINPWNTETARCVALLDAAYTPIAVAVFDSWTDNGCELSIATDGTKRWATRRFIRAVYSYAFDHCDKQRITMTVSVANLQALKLHQDLGHAMEGVLRDWHGEHQDAIVFSVLRREYVNSRWAKDRSATVSAPEQEVQQ